MPWQSSKTQRKRHFIRPRKRAWHFRWAQTPEAKAQAKASHDEEKVSEVWRCGPHGQPPEDQASQPFAEVPELLETETALTFEAALLYDFEAALLYDAAHGAGHSGLTRLYGMEPT